MENKEKEFKIISERTRISFDILLHLHHKNEVFKAEVEWYPNTIEFEHRYTDLYIRIWRLSNDNTWINDIPYNEYYYTLLEKEVKRLIEDTSLFTHFVFVPFNEE